VAEQLELPFEEAPASPRRPAAAPPRSPSTGATARPSRSRQSVASDIVEPTAIPAQCPVVRRPVCYYSDCHYYQHGGCVHPEATRRPRRRR